MHWVDILIQLWMPTYYIGVLVQHSVVSLLVQLPGTAPGKAVDDCSKIWSPATRAEDLGGVPGYFPGLDTALAVAGIWGIK